MEFISFLIVIGYSIYFFIRYRSLDSTLYKSISKCIPMILSMTSSIVIGLLIGIWLPQMLAVSTILSILSSGIVAFLIGSRFGLTGIMEAQGSSLMGAMMGAMLGVMLPANEVVVMIVAADFIYIVSMYLVMLMLTRDSVEKKKVVFTSKPASFYLMFFISISIVGGIGILQTGILEQPEVIENHMNHTHTH